VRGFHLPPLLSIAYCLSDTYLLMPANTESASASSRRARLAAAGDSLPVVASTNRVKIWYDISLCSLKTIGAPTSSREKMKTRAAPAAKPGSERGRVTVLNSLKPLAPRFSACSSRLGSMPTMLA